MEGTESTGRWEGVEEAATATGEGEKTESDTARKGDLCRIYCLS